MKMGARKVRANSMRELEIITASYLKGV